jgi:alcohol dehydrogenase, propanol-preferring
MTKTMKAAVVREFGKPLTIEEVPVPEPGPGMIQVAIQASGVCHTDLHAAEGDWPVKPNPPFIPGHEGVGYVSAVGAGVKHVKEGDRVGVPWLYTACGHCKHCLGGWETLCESQLNTGYSVNGGFAQYVVADPNYVGHLPANADFVEIAPVLCAGVTVYKGLKVTDTKPGDWVVISGIGGLGHMAVQYAKAMGLNVAAVDIDDAKLDLARRLGATVTVNAAQEDPAPVVRRETGGARGVLVTARSAARRSSRRSPWSTVAVPCRSTGCRRATFRCRSSEWCLTASPSAVRSSAPGSTSRNRSNSQRQAR